MQGEFAANTLISETGSALCVRLMVPPGAPRAIVQINHGMAEHCARYERFARFLASRGYAAIAHDHRGHGYTAAPGAPQGSFGRADGWQCVLDDVSAVAEQARAMFPGVPIVSFGHSLGAIIALDHALQRPQAAQALAIWNTSFDTPALLYVLVAALKAERFFKGSDVPSRLAIMATFEAWNRQFAPNRTQFDWLSRDDAEVDAYVADPLCGFAVSVGMWLQVIAAIRNCSASRLARLPKALPVHVCAGGKDPSSLGGAAMLRLAARLEAAGLRDVTSRVFSGNRHEGLNEIDRGAVMESFAAWLDARFPPR